MSAPPVYVSSCAFGTRSIRDALRTAEQWGIERIELSSGLAHDPDAADIARQASKNFQIKCHNYFPAPRDPFVLNLASSEPDIHERSTEHVRRLIQLTADVGDNACSVHAGFALDPATNELGRPIHTLASQPLDAARERFTETVARLTEFAGEVDVHFLIENNVLAPFNLGPSGANETLLMVEGQEMSQLARDVNADNFGLLIDTGHLRVSAHALGFDVEAAIDEVAPYVRAWHANWNDGRADTNEPFGPDCPLLKWVASVPADYAVIEVCRSDESTIGRCVDLVATAMEAARD